ncbi:MAG: MFS transporter [Cutibacterium sp.]|nr:MFS transporter [Cutibacterium sp.]
MRSYREVLAIREVWTTILLSALTRLPIFGLTMLITLHVVETLGMSYRLAGAVTTFVTISSMISAPWRGSMTDRRGLRRTMIPSIVVMTAVYAVAPWLGYYPLLVILALGYLWNYPIYTIPRQVLIATVPLRKRRAALSLDAVSIEICYMFGPMVAIIIASSVGTRTTMIGCAVLAAIGATGLTILNPPIAETSGAASDGQAPSSPSPDGTPSPNPRPAAEPDVVAQSSAAEALAAEGATRDPDAPTIDVPTAHPTKGSPLAWVNRFTVAILIGCLAAGYALGGIELTTVGAMRSLGSTQAIGWVLAFSGLGSALGGTIYGALNRSVPMPVLLTLMGLTAAATTLATSPLQAGLILLIGGLFVSPTLTASIDQLTSLTPPSRRGSVIGWQGSFLNAGVAISAPTIGAVIDGVGWHQAFILSGAVAAVIGLAVGAVMRTRSRRSFP